MKSKRFLITRRILQLTILLLFIIAHYIDLNILTGNYSSAKILDKVPLADPFAVMQMLFSGYLLKMDALWGALIILVFYMLAGGRVFCSWVCPYNMISDGILYLRRKLSFLNETNIRFSKRIRLYALVISLLMSTILGFAAFEMVNPISSFYRAMIFGVTASFVGVAVLVLFDMAIMKNGWCGHLCPIGAFYSLIGKWGVLKVYHDVRKCTSCNDCFKVCHEVQVLDIIGKEDGHILSDDCTKCGRCIEVCREDALIFTNRYKKME